MDYHLERGKLLLAQNRIPEAEAEFKQALAQDPNNGLILGWLAECNLLSKKFKEGLELSERAIGLMPDSNFIRYALARAYFYNQRIADARQAVRQALEQDPNDADFFLLLAHIEFHQSMWAPALKAAEQGLALDPENVGLINIRTQALVKLDRKAEAAHTADFALHKSPEDSYSHANRGWVAIEQGEYKAAQQHFMEALRLNPNSDYAQSGLKESIKGQNVIYRGMLRYFLWVAKMNEQNRWAFIIGAYVAYRLVLALADNFPALSPFLYPIVGFYILFALSSWIAVPLSNLFLRLHPIGKHALSDDERLASNLAGGVLGSALACLAGFLLTQSSALLLLSVILGLLLVPTGGAFSVEPGTKARKSLLAYGSLLAICGIIGVLWPQGSWFLIVFGIGIFAYGWVANYLIGQDAKAF